MYGDPGFIKQTTCKGRVCLEDGCVSLARKKLLCNVHYTVLWRLENPSLARKNTSQCSHTRSTREKGIVGKHTRSEWENLLEMHNHLCAYCRLKPATDRDHVVPISKGGTGYISNILPSCKSCNCKKSSKDLGDFLSSNGMSINYNGKQYGAV